jgi:diguanylate cyclase (GGDEF)-like protein
MSPELVYALLSLAPAATVLASYPRRPMAAVAALAASLGAAAAFLLLTPEPGRLQAAVIAAWSVLGAVCALLLSRRAVAGYEKVLAGLQSVRAKRAAVAEELAAIKTAGTRTEREQKESLALYGMIKGLSEALTWEDIKPKLDAAVGQYLGVTDFALYIAAEAGREGFQTLSARRLENSPGGSWATWGRYLQEQGLNVSEAHLIERPERAVGLPVHDSGELLGYFYARLPYGMEPSPALAKARTFCSEIAFAFRRVRLFQEVDRLSQVDGLTGVYRRGTFDDRIREEAIRAKTFKTSFGLMLLDIDHFKQLNDRYGHPFGDQVLKRMGELLNGSVYETDFVARYGGEEFVILLPRAELEGVKRKAESIRQVVEAEKFTLAFETIRVTVSIGIAHFPEDAGSPEELIACADSAMYQAKSQGRNRVVSYAVGRTS